MSFLIHIVAGPTASGKSAFAMELAAKYNGVIVNCDSLQVYEGLPILTAQPSADDYRKVPHELYANRNPNDACSAGNWVEMAIPCIRRILESGQTPIVTGGTGLYIKALMEGLSPIPDIPDDIRRESEQLQKKLGNPAFHEALKERDPVMAERFHPFHTARLIRAWEVIEATGKSLAEWQAIPPSGPPDGWTFKVHKIMPERETLYERCNKRFDWMLENGAWEEVEGFQNDINDGKVNAGVPLTKALGFKYLRKVLNGTMSKDEAIEKSKTQTRRYAKRQVTWFRHQLQD